MNKTNMNVILKIFSQINKTFLSLAAGPLSKLKSSIKKIDLNLVLKILEHVNGIISLIICFLSLYVVYVYTRTESLHEAMYYAPVITMVIIPLCYLLYIITSMIIIEILKNKK